MDYKELLNILGSKIEMRKFLSNGRKIDRTRTQSFLSKEYNGIEKLENLENYLKFYNTFLVKKLIRFGELDKPNKRVLDFGAGLGGIAKEIYKYSGTKPYCAEIDPKMCRKIEESGFTLIDISNFDKPFDFIYSSNVLEHIEQDIKTLIELREALTEEGKLVIYVPAFMILYSEFDSSIGHFRRYRKKDLISKVSAASLKVEEIYYVDSIGFFVALISKILISITGYDTFSKPSLLFYDRVIFPLSRFLDIAGLKYLFGKNLLVVLRR